MDYESFQVIPLATQHSPVLLTCHDIENYITSGPEEEDRTSAQLNQSSKQRNQRFVFNHMTFSLYLLQLNLNLTLLALLPLLTTPTVIVQVITIKDLLPKPLIH
jgi:hypothetical protein